MRREKALYLSCAVFPLSLIYVGIQRIDRMGRVMMLYESVGNTCFLHIIVRLFERI